MTPRRQLVRRLVAISLCLGFTLALSVQCFAENRPERVEWFRDAGFGMFVHWSVDSQLGSVISHSLVGSSPDYAKRFFELLPRTFNPVRYKPDDWAVLASLAGMKYVVFTTKHHSGFCMYDTATTGYSIRTTPFAKDITAGLVSTFRARGVAPGFYFSPDDFYYQYTHGQTINRGKTMLADQAYMDYNKAQLRELLTNYGDIHALFFDGPPEGLKELAWQLQPNVVVTRGAMDTPEQYIPGIPMDKPWEACLTMGTQWHYKPTNEVYKSGTDLIEILIETRAKGGNLLLNVGPKPDGELPIEQEARLREIALWNFVNGESIYAVRPWVVTNEKNIWFTKKKGEDTVYAFLTKEHPWPLGAYKESTLKSVRAAGDSVVSVLGQSGEVLEYSTQIPRTTWKQEEDGLHIRAARAQRLYNDKKWPNPVVLKITHALPNMVPPEVHTIAVRYDPARKAALLEGDLRNLGKAASVEAGFQYRILMGGGDVFEKKGEWQDVRYVARSAVGPFSMEMPALVQGQTYQFRAVVKHPLITLYGEEKTLRAGSR